MNFGKAKTILIIFLVFVNISLFTYIKIDNANTQKNKNKVIDTCIELLNKNGISADISLFSDEPTEIPSAYGENFVSSYDEFSEKILGKDYIKTDSNTYSSDKGVLSFDGDMFRFKANGVIKKQTVTEKNAGITAKQYLDSLGIVQDNKEFVVSLTPNGEYEVQLSKMINSFPVFDSYIKIFLNSDGITSAEGIWYMENKNSAPDYQIRSITNVFVDYLAELPDNINTKITSVTLGYQTLESGVFHESVSLVPVYKIENDQGKTIYINAQEKE